MANAPGKDKPLQPETPPKQPSPLSSSTPTTTTTTTTELARKLEDLAAQLTRSEERTSTLYRDLALALQQQQPVEQLSAELSDLRAEFSAFQSAHCQLRGEHVRLESEHRSLKASLQSSQGKAHQTLAEVKLYLDAFQADHSKLLNGQGSLGEGLEALARDVSSLQTQLQPGLAAQLQDLRTQQRDLQKETASLKEEVTSQSRDMAGLRDRSSLDAGLLQALQSDFGQLQNARGEESANLEAALETLRSQVAALEAGQRQQPLLTRHADAEERSLRAELADEDTMGTYTVNPNPETVLQEMARKPPVPKVQLSQLQKCLDNLNRMKIEMKMKTFQPVPSEPASLGLRRSDTESGFQENDRPLFKASILSKRRTKQDQAMIFEMAELNGGGHYDVETGVFTVPEGGFYCFSLRAGARDASDIVHCGLMVEDRQHFKFELVHADQTRWARVCVELAPGETVWVKALSPLGRYDSSYVFHFTGALTRCPSPPLPPPPVFE